MILSLCLTLFQSSAVEAAVNFTGLQSASSHTEAQTVGQAKGDDKKKPKEPAGTGPGKNEKKDDKAKGDAGGLDLEGLLTASGRTKSSDGDWLTADEQQKLKDGWTRQDLEWVAPNEAANVGQNKWKCGDKWLALDEANDYHAKVGNWWRLRGKYFDVYSTCKREVALEAVKEADSTFAHLERLFGRVPPMRPVVLVLNSADQYNTFAAGDGRSSPDLRGLSSVHGAFFAELWTEPLQRGSYSGSGVCYLDASNDAGWSYGRTYVRHAAGQSFTEALDPSVNTLASVTTKKWKGEELAEAFWSEKKLPQWFRYGAASYVERYFQDTSASDPKALLKWSVQNIANKGGLDPLKKVYGFEFGGDPQADLKLINECGLLIAFAVDGGIKDISDKHGALRAALKTGKNLDKALSALEDEIKKNEAKLREFAGL
ncbi:MAG: hypothetical protein IT453_08360 [Planctomycetes bacterium]|nr:hypothetical protein [Planctomycetota bacterium]